MTRPDDELVDLFPGSGAVADAWARWCAAPRLELTVDDDRADVHDRQPNGAAA